MSERIRKLISEAMSNANFITESSLSRIWKHIENGQGFGVISPFRREFSMEQNEKRYIDLKSRVKSKGYGFIELIGGFIEDGVPVREKSLFIPGIKKDDLISWGQEFDQYSVIFKDDNEFVEIGTNRDSGIGTIKNDFIKSGWDKNLTLNPEATKEFWSELIKGSHRGRKFLFNLKESYLFEITPLSFNEIAYGKKKDGIDNNLIRIA